MGKTTVSATLVVKAAHLGLRTVVLTIDPANRLADALGVPQSMKMPTRVQLSDNDAQLYGLMMDRKDTCDELVSRFSNNKEVEEKISPTRIIITFLAHLLVGKNICHRKG